MALIPLIRKNPPADWRFPFRRGDVRRILAVMGAAAGVARGEVEIRFVTDAEMARLNTEALGLPGPTNVLAFPAGGSSLTSSAGEGEGGPLLGSLAISPETLLRECLLYGQEPEEHALRLLAHGLAHLLGHDHGPVMDVLCRKMEEAAEEEWAAASGSL